MDFQQFAQDIAGSQSPKWTRRQKRLDAFDRALYGELYRHKASPFSQELQNPNLPNSDRILLDARRAAVQYRLPLMLVRDVVGRLWGEAHRPNVVVRNDPKTSSWIQAFIRDTSFWLTLLEASWCGSSGSTVVVLRVLADDDKPGKFFAEVWPTKECQPVFKRSRPSELESLERIQFVTADTLRAEGYDVDQLEDEWQRKKFGRSLAGRSRSTDNQRQTSDEWAMRLVLDKQSETWYQPIPRWLFDRPDFQSSEWVKDANRSFAHGLGEVPARWARPVPFPASTFPDGLCLFEPVIDYQFRIDRSLSQTGRAFDYVGDPQLSYDGSDRSKTGDGSFGGDDMPDDAGASAIIPGGAEFVEISGDGLRVSVEIYVKSLIRLAREVGGGSRIDDESQLGTSMSAVAMRLLNASLDVLAGIMRITLGEKLFVDTLQLAMRMATKVAVDLPSLKAIAEDNEATVGDPDPNALLDLQWPDAYAPTGQDLLFTVQAIQAASSAAAGAPIISNETAVGTGASLFGVVDAVKEQANIIAETQLRNDLQPVDPNAALAQSDSGSKDKSGTSSSSSGAGS